MIDRRALTAAEISAQSTSSHWASAIDGNWTNAANWSTGIAGTGGIRTAIFDYRDFASDFTNGNARAIVRDGDSIVLDRIEMYGAANRTFFIQGADDNAAAQMTLTGDAVTGRASIYIDTAAGTQAGFARGTRSSVHIVLDAELDVTVTANSTFSVDAIFEGAHGIDKYGAGTMILHRASTFSGGLEIRAGIVRANAIDAVGTGDITFHGGELNFTAAGTVANDLIVTGGVNRLTTSASITLTGDLSVSGDASSEFYLMGDPSRRYLDSEVPHTLTLDFNSLNLTSTGAMYLRGIRLGNAFLAEHLFMDSSPTKLFLYSIDTNGFATHFRDLNFRYNPVFKSTGGALDLTFHATAPIVVRPDTRIFATSAVDTVRFVQDLPGQGLVADLKELFFAGASADDAFLIEFTNFDDHVYLPLRFAVPKLLTYDGNDWVTCEKGTEVALGAGNDFVQGSVENDILFGGSGDDDLRGGGGKDSLNGGTGADRMEGGTGDDIFFVDNASDIVIEDSSSAGGWDEVRISGIDYVMPSYVENARVSRGANTVTGNSLHNLIAGSNDANTLIGADGNDFLKGNGGADILRGGFGNDALVGGFGRDVLNGGEGADRFTFNDPLETKPNRNFADVIEDFYQSEGDKIVLSAIDADTTVDGDQAFTFIGTAAFGNHAGELRYTIEGASTFVEADLDGDGRVDLTIVLNGNIPLVATDFTL